MVRPTEPRTGWSLRPERLPEEVGKFFLSIYNKQKNHGASRVTVNRVWNRFFTIHQTTVSILRSDLNSGIFIALKLSRKTNIPVLTFSHPGFKKIK